MLQIFLCTDQLKLRQEILNRISNLAAEGVQGQLLLVPEQASHETERALCAAGGDGICLFAEVLSFSRLANRVSTAYGGVCRGAMDKGGRLMAMSLALESVASRLKLYGASRKKPEFLQRMLSMLDELKSACIDAQQLKKVSSEVEGQLAVKLEELSLILEGMETATAQMGQDPFDRMTQLREQLTEHAYAAGKRIWVLGFSDFTGQELGILQELLQQSGSVTVGLLNDGSDAGPFAMSADTLRRLKRLADHCGQSVEVQILPSGQEKEPELSYLEQHLFTGAVISWGGKSEAVTLHHSGDVGTACMDAADRIQTLARNGMRYRDMAICCTQLEQYRPALESILSRFSIPAYFSGVEPVSSNPIAGPILSALDAATGGMEPSDVLDFLKSVLSPVETDDCDRLELYVRTWNIRGDKWKQTWDMHPDGYGQPMDDDAVGRLSMINATRKKGVAPLLRLQEGLRSADTTGKQVLALYDFLEDIGLAEKLEAMYSRYQTQAQFQKAQAYGQMFETISGALEQMYLVLGNTVRSGEDFAGLIATLFSQYHVGTIPANLDSVTVGSPETLRFSQCKALFVLGAEDGLLPAYQTENSLLNPRERRTLLNLGLGIAPDQSSGVDRQLMCIYQVFTSASEQVYLNTATPSPSYLFQRLAALYPESPVKEDDAIPRILLSSPETLGDLLAASRSDPALEPLRKAVSQEVLEAANTLSNRADYHLGVLSVPQVRALYGSKLYLSASRIDQYAACRCAYFLNYGLRLKPQKAATFDAPIYGTFVHAVLEKTAKRVMEEGGFHAVSEERLVAIAQEIMDAYRDPTLEIMLQRSQRMAYLFSRNREEVLAVVKDLGNELRRSEFTPAGFEVEFSPTGQLPPVVVQGQDAVAEISGFVDRVDLYTHGDTTYARVVDYKTGKKAFDYTDLLNGMGMQMLIYLFALEEHGAKLFDQSIHPAGVLYMPARKPILPVTGKLSEEDAALKQQLEHVRKGLVLKSDLILEAMEHCDGSPVYLPYQKNRSGELVGDLADLEEMGLLKAHVRRELETMTDSIFKGEVEANPIVRGSENTACSYCVFASICHRASGELKMRPMRKTERGKFWDSLRKELEQHD